MVEGVTLEELVAIKSAQMGRQAWVVVSSLLLLAFGVWIAIVAPEPWKKAFAGLNAIHGALVLWAMLSKRIPKYWYQASGVVFVLVWAGGSLDHGLISAFEGFLLVLLVVFVHSQLSALARSRGEGAWFRAAATGIAVDGPFRRERRSQDS